MKTGRQEGLVKTALKLKQDHKDHLTLQQSKAKAKFLTFDKGLVIKSTLPIRGQSRHLPNGVWGWEGSGAGHYCYHRKFSFPPLAQPWAQVRKISQVINTQLVVVKKAAECQKNKTNVNLIVVNVVNAASYRDT